MAELGVAGSIVGIVSLAWSLSKKLYEFGSTTSAAGEQVDFIAKNVTNYACALELLAERFDDDHPVHSARAIKVVDNLYDQSCDLFDRIEDMLPEPRRGRDDLSFLQKLTWNFKKKNVEFLASQIEYLKTTTNLLATILFTGKRIRARRKSHKHKRASKSEEASVENDQARINVAIVEQVEACKNLSNLKFQGDESVNTILEAAEASSAVQTEARSSNGLILHQESVHPILLVALPQGGELSVQRQAVLEQVDNTFQQLLSQFTTIEHDTGIDDHPARSSQRKDTHRPAENISTLDSSEPPPAERHERLSSSRSAYPLGGSPVSTTSELKTKVKVEKERGLKSQRRDQEQHQNLSTKHPPRRNTTVESDFSASESEMANSKHPMDSNKPSPKTRGNGGEEVARSPTSVSEGSAYEREVDSDADKWHYHHQAARNFAMPMHTRVATLGARSDAPIDASKLGRTTTDPYAPGNRTDEESGDQEWETRPEAKRDEKGKVAGSAGVSKSSTRRKGPRLSRGSYQGLPMDQGPWEQRSHEPTQTKFPEAQHTKMEGQSGHVTAAENPRSEPARGRHDFIPRLRTRFGDRDNSPDENCRGEERDRSRHSDTLKVRRFWEAERSFNYDDIHGDLHEIIYYAELDADPATDVPGERYAARIREGFYEGSEVTAAEFDFYEKWTGSSLL